MCIVAFRWQPESSEPLTLAANRDEFFARPTAAMYWWQGDEMLAGRDLQSGGTWLGITRGGRFALLTNVRNPALRKTDAPSRGKIVSDFLQADESAEAFVHDLAARANAYEGFNVLCGTISSRADGTLNALWFLNSTEQTPRPLSSGDYALSNATLNTPWPKTEHLKAAFALATEERDTNARLHAMRSALLDDHRADDAALPATGVPIEWERALSSVFIRNAFAARAYGTRSSTVIDVQRHGNVPRVHVAETTHREVTTNASHVVYEFELMLA
jgi:uncharacterized protein with NRDE domain